jgi:hypothetical protein
MKISKVESYSIEGLSKEEVIFLFNIVNQVQLSESSDPLAFDFIKKFKQLSSQYLDTPPIEQESLPPELLQCEGCELESQSNTETISMKLCPISKKSMLLCDQCFNKRTEIQQALEKL